MSAFGGHPIHLHMPMLRAAAAAGEAAEPKFADLGISDTEQIVALANRDDVREKLAASLHVGTDVLDTLVEDAKRVLPPALLAEMEQPLPPIYPLGAVEPPVAAELPVAFEMIDAAGLPQTVNLIASMSPIRNQGARGTCVSFTLTAINEFVRTLQHSPQDLSEQHLYHEIKLIDGQPALCGTWQRVGAQVLNGQGQCREVIWPYNPNPPCNNNGVLPPGARPDALNFKLALVALGATDVVAIKSALAGQRPVGISIPVYNSWYQSPETKRSGRITMPLTNDTRTGGHAICAVGYQDDAAAPGGGYFIVRNHWSTSWGYQNPYGQGYGTLPYRYITSYGWEAYTLAGPVHLAEPSAPPARSERTITVTIRGNVNLIIE